ncbi:MAG TPA: glycosyltransferase [Anaeromyxobacteraceae bacterium]|nr:glycosyltransferase [Anaeromyxobacteraceae bacterium]
MSPPDPRPLRIAMVLDSWDDANNGAVVSTRRFVELLRGRGHQVTVVATGRPEPGKVTLPRFRVPFFDGLMRKMRYPFAWPERRVLEEVLSRQDVVHVMAPFYLGVRAAALARRAGVPVVSSFHVQAEHLLHNVGIRNRAMVARVYRLFLRTLYDRSAHVVCPSPFAERELRRYGLRAPATVISNGLPPQYRPLPRSQWPDVGGKVLVLSVGRLAREKRHDLTIEAIRRSRHEARIQLVIIGDGPLRQPIEARARGLANPPRFLYLPTPELIPWYSAADLYVHAAEVELECMSVLEAMGCGAPCLIARSPLSATSQFAISEDFLFPAGDRQALTARLDWFLDHPEALREARPRSRQAAEAYRIESSLARLLDVYERVTAGREARSIPARRAGAAAATGR